MPRPRVAMCLSACGVAAPLLWASAVIFSGSRHPEYSHIRQYIGDLAARGSSTGHVMQAAAFILPVSRGVLNVWMLVCASLMLVRQ